MEGYAYAGSELEIFAAAKTWKAYWASLVRPFLSGEVLEVGAGIGVNTQLLCDPGRGAQWLCLEPDASLAERLRRAVQQASLEPVCRVVVGTVEEVDAVQSFDCALYVDVLEHIEDDAGEIERASTLLRPGGHLVVLAPAHGWLYSEFDRAIGHHRRYSRSSLLGLASPPLTPVRAIYLDAVGLLTSLANRAVLKQSLPTAAQIVAWDSWMVPVSRIVDRLLLYRFGRSVLVVWRKASHA